MFRANRKKRVYMSQQQYDAVVDAIDTHKELMDGADQKYQEWVKNNVIEPLNELIKGWDKKQFIHQDKTK